MNVTEVETKESTKYCCGNGCRRMDSAEHKGAGGVDGMEVDELLRYLKDNGEEIMVWEIRGYNYRRTARRTSKPALCQYHAE